MSTITARPATHPSASFSATLRVHLDNQPGSFGRLADFLSLYVARTPPNGIKQFVAPLLASTITGIGGL